MNVGGPLDDWGLSPEEVQAYLLILTGILRRDAEAS